MSRLDEFDLSMLRKGMFSSCEDLGRRTSTRPSLAGIVELVELI